MKIYLKGQEQTDAYDKYDYEMCGDNQPTTMLSDGPRLVMIFASGDSQGRGFKARYSFATGLQISLHVIISVGIKDFSRVAQN